MWDQAGWLPHEVRLGVAVVIAVAGLLFALLQPGGRPLDQWLLAGVLYVALPRRLVWRPGAAQPAPASAPAVGLGRTRAASGLGRDQ